MPAAGARKATWRGMAWSFGTRASPAGPSGSSLDPQGQASDRRAPAVLACGEDSRSEVPMRSLPTRARLRAALLIGALLLQPAHAVEESASKSERIQSLVQSAAKLLVEMRTQLTDIQAQADAVAANAG